MADGQVIVLLAGYFHVEQLLLLLFDNWTCKYKSCQSLNIWNCDYFFDVTIIYLVNREHS